MKRNKGKVRSKRNSLNPLPDSDSEYPHSSFSPKFKQKPTKEKEGKNTITYPKASTPWLFIINTKVAIEEESSVAKEPMERKMEMAKQSSKEEEEKNG